MKSIPIDLWQASRLVLNTSRYRAGLTGLTALLLAVYLFLPVWLTPGNDLAFQLSILLPRDYALFAVLSGVTALLVLMQTYVQIRVRKRRAALAAVGSSGVSVGSAIFGGLLATAGVRLMHRGTPWLPWSGQRLLCSRAPDTDRCRCPRPGRYRAHLLGETRRGLLRILRNQPRRSAMTRSLKQHTRVIGTLVVLGLGGWLLVNGSSNGPQDTAEARLTVGTSVGDQAPNFTITDIEGNRVTNEALRAML